MCFLVNDTGTIHSAEGTPGHTLKDSFSDNRPSASPTLSNNKDSTLASEVAERVS